jgi:hypothetical protein
MQTIQSRKKFLQQFIVAAAAIGFKPLQIFANANTINNVTYFAKGEIQYETLRKGFNKRIEKYPAIIALCNNEAGVSEAILYAKKSNLKVTIKSGGHCMEGFSCLQDGMVINLSLLNTIELDKNTVTVGPAVQLKQLYEILLPKGKYVPGGSCQTVAIGGLTLGGGYGILSRVYGLTCDSLLQATMVDGNGVVHKTIVGEQLMWALKGGGNGNFGVVTQMKFTAHKAPSNLLSLKFRCQTKSIEKAKEICKDWFTYSKTLPNTCFSAFIYNGKTTYILLTNIGKATPTVDAFIQHFKASATKFTQGKTLPLATALKAYYAEASPITFKNASSGLYKDFNDIEAAIDKVFALVQQSPGILYQVNTLGGAIQNKTYAKNAAFPHRDCFYFSELQAYWDNPSQTGKKLLQFEAIQKEFAAVGVNAQYRNYPDINFTNWKQMYYGANLGVLEEIKKQYDPNNIFGGVQTL